MRPYAMVCCILLLSLLSGCFSPVREKPAKTYVLGDHVVDLKNTTHDMETKKILLVLPSDTNTLFDTDRMAYTNQRYQINYFNYSQWAALPSQMLLTATAQALQNTHYFKAVVTPPYIGRSDYMLKINIQKLQQNLQTATPMAELMITAQLYHTDNNILLATHQWQWRQPMVATTPNAGVIAFNHEVNQFLEKLTLFLMHNTRGK